MSPDSSLSSSSSRRRSMLSSTRSLVSSRTVCHQSSTPLRAPRRLAIGMLPSPDSSGHGLGRRLRRRQGVELGGEVDDGALQVGDLLGEVVVIVVVPYAVD